MADLPSSQGDADAAGVPPPRRRRRRVAWWLGGSGVALSLLAIAAAALLWWALTSATGTAWLLARAPQLRVTAPQGSLLGDFSAERLEITFADAGTLRLDAPRWQALAAGRGDHGRWLHLTIAALHAQRATWLPAPPKPGAASEPASPPSSLRLPIELEVRAASIDELRIGSLDATPIRALRARIHLGADGGAVHRFDDAAAAIDRGAAHGSATIGADAPFPLTARIDADSAGLTPAFQARIDASGRLDAIAVAAHAQVAAADKKAAQSLDATATVRPFAAWPLGELRATLVGLDLSAFTTMAPATSLSGHATATTTAANTPAVVSLDLVNARAGRWNEGLLPVTHAVAELRARPDQPEVLEVRKLAAELGSAALPGGRITGRGSWTAARWNVDAELAGVRPVALDARAPETSISGPVTLAGTGFDAEATRAVDLTARLAGQLADRRLPNAAPRAARLRLEARASADAIEIRIAEAALGDAAASLGGSLQRSTSAAPWQAKGRVRLAGFDPAPWWPGGAGSLFAGGASRLDAKGDFDLTLPPASSGATAVDTLALIAATRGTATVVIADSLLAGVAVAGQAAFANGDGTARPRLDLTAAGNRVQAEGRLAARGTTSDDWQIAIEAPRLDALSPWLGAKATPPRLAGALSAKAHVAGRWPTLVSDGELQATALRVDGLAVQRASGRWRVGSAADAALDATLEADGIVAGERRIGRAEARLAGTARSHRVELRIDSTALPPAWADALALRAAGGVTAADVAAAASAAAFASATASAARPRATANTVVAGPAVAASAATTAPTTARSSVVLSAEGGLVDAGTERAAGWRGAVHELSVHALGRPERIWLRARELRGAFFWAGGPMRATVEPGTADAFGATLRWSRIAWQQGEGATPPRLDVQASIDTFPISPVLAALQPEFGWGGDLAVAARIDVRSAPSVHVDVALERKAGDLTVTDEIGTQPLAITAFRLGLAADQGQWRFSADVAGGTLGVASARIGARTSANAAWPGAETPIEGSVDLAVANLGTWGNWVPAGWRLAGALQAHAAVSGRFGAPQYTGRVEGERLGVRNFVEGVNVTDGSVAIALQGNRARIERFTAKGGSGTLRVEGEAAFDDAPSARLRLFAERFELLGRVDRRIVVSGDGSLRIDKKTLGVDGRFTVDEGLVNFTRSDAPTLGGDVEVVRRPAVATVASATPAQAAASAVAAASARPPAPPGRSVELDLRVGMGEKLRVRGRGLDAGLRGELHLTSPAGRLAVNGTLSAVDGTYQAYGQKLGIDRGVLTFVGPVENPRLDIEATRPDVDVRVGVTVSGTALNPRIRLFSEPELSDLDKLSWLVLGRASETTGGADTALLQQAALALLSGEGPGVTDRLIKSIGLDAVAVRQSQGAVKDTIVSLGKQISKRWYVGYERGLNTTTGTWQLIYRVAQRITVRAEAGSDNAVDVTWTLRWR